MSHKFHIVRKSGSSKFSGTFIKLELRLNGVFFIKSLNTTLDDVYDFQSEGAAGEGQRKIAEVQPW